MVKKAISNVVTVVLMILIVLLAILLSWNLILKVTSDNSQDINTDRLSVSLSVPPIDFSSISSSNCYSSQPYIKIPVSRNPNNVQGGTFDAIWIIFHDASGNTFTYKNSTRIPSELEQVVYYIVNIPADFHPVSYEVYPYIKTSSGKMTPGFKADEVDSLGTIKAVCCNNNGTCDPGEDCLSCPSDCGSCVSGITPPSHVCGDGILDSPSEQCEVGINCTYNRICDNCQCSECNVKLNPGTDVIYNAILNSPNSSAPGFDQYTICLNDGNYSEGLFGANSDYSMWNNKNGLTLVGLSDHPIIDLMGYDSINVHSAYVTLKNLEIKNASTQGAIAKNNYFRFINNIVHDVGKDGVQLNPGTYGHLVANNTFYNDAEDAIACNGCSQSVISHNYIGRGISGPSPAYNDGGIYIYNSPGVILMCNLISQSDLDGIGKFPQGIGLALGSGFDVNITDNYINKSIVYASTNPPAIVGPIVMSDVNGTFVFTNNYCNMSASSCIDRDGAGYNCCSNEPNDTGYNEWKSICGAVGAN